MRDDEGGTPLHQPVERPLDLRFGIHVQRTGRFVENQYARIAQQRAGDRDALLLTAGETRAVFAHLRVQPLRQRIDQRHQVGVAHRVHQLELRRVGSVTDIVADRAVEEQRLLRDHRDKGAVAAQIQLVHIASVQQQPARRRPDEADHQMGDRGFPRPRRPHQRDGFAGGHMQADILQRMRLAARILEADVVEYKITGHRGHLRLVFVQLDIGALQHFADRLDRLHALGDRGQAVHRREHRAGDGAEIVRQQPDVADADLQDALFVQERDQHQREEVEQHQDHPVHRTEDRVHVIDLKPRLADLLQPPVHPADLHVFDVVGAGDRNQPEHFSDPPGHILDAFAELPVGLRHALADRNVKHHRQRHRRHVEHNEQRRLDRGHRHRHRQRADDVRHGVEQHAGHVFDALHISRDLVLQRPHLRRGVVRNREMLKPGAERRPQIAFDGAARHAHQPHVIHVSRDVLHDHHKTDTENPVKPLVEHLRRQSAFRDHIDDFRGQDRQHISRCGLDHIHLPDLQEAQLVPGIKTEIFL